jgi:hypothetical protein
MEEARWFKAHLICAHDERRYLASKSAMNIPAIVRALPALVKATAKGFKMSEVSADAAYGRATGASWKIPCPFSLRRCARKSRATRQPSAERNKKSFFCLPRVAHRRCAFGASPWAKFCRASGAVLSR